MSERGKSATGVSGGKIALYRKYRPVSLSDVVGQPQVTDVLNAAVKVSQFAHAYLLTGQRGTGKTSTARILAHLINDTPYNADDPNSDLDIIEIDAASRGSVDDARELRDKSAIAPVAAAHKIYIIDEVHMLSTPAFNALLKIIEEPPAHIVFILATTEIQKVPATILSRVQRFHFRPVSTETVANHLRQIADQEKIKIEDEALNLIAKRGQGSFRDSISLLDQLSNSDSKITHVTVEEILGLAPETAISAIVDAVTSRDMPILITTLNNLFKEGVPPALIVDQLIDKLSKLASENPKLYDLIEKLLEVAKSHAPDIKLTAILATATAKNTTIVAATAVATPRKSEIVEEKLTKIIEKKIEKEKEESPREDVVVEEITGEIEEKIEKQEVQPMQRTVTDKADCPTEIVWEDVLTEVKNLDQPAMLATLKFADFDYNDGQITLYFSKSFHRKKATSAKFRDVVSKAFQKLYTVHPQISISESAVREDSDAAKILDIMGGGEVVRNGKA